MISSSLQLVQQQCVLVSSAPEIYAVYRNATLNAESHVNFATIMEVERMVRIMYLPLGDGASVLHSKSDLTGLPFQGGTDECFLIALDHGIGFGWDKLFYKQMIIIACPFSDVVANELNNQTVELCLR